MQWVDKYSPSTLSQLVGQEQPSTQIQSYLQSFKRGKALLIWGPTGCGKTSAVYAIANDQNAELIEMNASDLRNKNAINEFLGSVIGQQSLFSQLKIILIDEVDLFSGIYDRGGIQALSKIIETSTFPVICTANNPFDKKLKPLRKISTLVELSQLDHSIIFTTLKNISQKESISLPDPVLKTLARKAGGDLRGAIHDLQTLSSSPDNDPESFLASERRKTETIEQALTKVFKSTSPELYRGAFDLVGENIDTIFLWVDNNLPREYTKNKDRKRAYDALSKADIFRGRIRKQQYYRYYVYIFELLTSGIALAKKERYPGISEYKESMRILRIWQANMKYAKRKIIAEKLANKTHQSQKQAFQQIPLMKIAFQKNKDYAEKITSELNLDKDEADWLNK
ncbi:hypothetical protein CMO92_02905 [Candidatus Woesearchaeota archaeon]|nr:hypothetical protein [Candidatus Woesearchaeota archaeon]|tara:strand:+ start:1039 stop:2229 length:1191 start_codon:yes stop_codon:yes gene_type:complete